MLTRAALFTSLLLALWTFAPCALAMPAGLCDDRGASAIASPPALEAPDVAIWRAQVSSSCADPKLPPYARIVPAHRSLSPSAGTHDNALPVAAVALAGAVGARIKLGMRVERPPTGICWRLERPPRG